MSATPADYLQLQGAVSGTPARTPGYTRLNAQVGPVVRYVEFVTGAIAPGFGPYPSGSHLPIPVSVESLLYFSDYATPPALGGPVNLRTGVAINTTIQRGSPPPKPDGYLASDGTVLTTSSTSGQITGFTGKGKDGHTYALSVAITSGMAAGRTSAEVSWAWARMSVTQDGDTPLIFGIGYCPSDNLMNVFLEKDNVQTSMVIDYSQSAPQNGNTKVTRNLTYYGPSYMAETTTVPATQADPQIYIPLNAFWPYINRITFFGPALSSILSTTGALLPQIPPADTPAILLGSIAFGSYTPDSLSEAAFVYSAIGTVGPALGPLAASVMTGGVVGGPELQDAAQWLAWLLLIIGETSLTATLSGDYSAWATWISQQRPVLPKKVPVLYMYPKDAKGKMITYKENPWGTPPSQQQIAAMLTAVLEAAAKI
jgi:hypothetical protein